MEPGVVIGGRYRLVEPLASGGMGTVWRARHVELDVDVAVKLMSDALARSPSALARFQREAKAAAQLKSPHVVQVFDYGVDAARPYLAMELLEGEDLRTHLERVGAMSLDRIAKVLDGLAKALKLAHAAGIVHRDLKPANVFLQRSSDDEVVKILDFGIAKDLGPVVDGLKTSSSSVVGSPLYMSPEQVRGTEVDHRTDLWALAVIAFEMATGRHPFDGASLGDVFARIIADDIPIATTCAPWLPQSLDGFFERALARPVARRFGSAQELADAFRASMGDAPSREVPALRDIAAARVLPDAPTIDASAIDASAMDDPMRAAASAVAAHTSAQVEAGARTAELARTVATPPPSVQTPSMPPARGASKAVFGVVLVVVAGAAIGTALAIRGEGTAATETAFPESSRPAGAATSAPSGPSVEPEGSASTTVAAPASASAYASSSASAAGPPPSAPSVAPQLGRLPPRPPPAPPTSPPKPPKPTTEIDPTFGVPVKKP